MTVMIPEKDELRYRIVDHLRARPDNPTVSAVWYGYLAGLLEWGVLEINDHAELVELLSDCGIEETNEASLGPDYLDRVPELTVRSGNNLSR